MSFGKRSVQLLAVSKFVSVEGVKQAILAGIDSIAESRIQEAIPKFEELASLEDVKTEFARVKKHFIGHLQTNKAKKAVEFFDIIQSLDSLRLAEAINRHAQALGKTQECFIEVKVSKEASKTGVEIENAIAFYNEVKQLKNIEITGIMTMAPLTEDASGQYYPEGARPYFKQAYALFNEIKCLRHLSMGMSGDYEIAVEEGSTMVRVGSLIFGERYYDN